MMQGGFHGHKSFRSNILENKRFTDLKEHLFSLFSFSW